ncbi:DinB family protein [Microvirga arabica]|uniref:DinB family protein n=1 Tax=Microvirga arabica TaxID=1128671 RepID=UPI00193984BD|nr:DinB family protein [Microvirga arabica]MBM1169958.1 DinB family protein [Microvirga arabica]
MHSRFDEFRATPLGQQLEALANAPERYLEYAALSRVGVPAIAAIVHDLQTHFPEIAGNQAARQFCGAAVAEVMRLHHHDVLRPRGRVPGDLFTYGAIWTPLPRRLPFPELLAALRALPDEIGRRFAAVRFARRRDRPVGTGLSAVEYLCHLRDLDAVYAERVRLVLAEDLPELPSVDGLAMATERGYATQNPEAALAALGRARAALLRLLEKTSPVQRQRTGLRDGVRRVTLLELVEEIHRHDRTHVQEMNELAAEMGGLEMEME